jgi:4'-phosphopantetheinyl transferase
MTPSAGAPVRLPVATGLDLWCLDLLAPPALPQQAGLSAQEFQKAARFVFERDRRRYLSAHSQLRRLLADYTGIAPARLEFEEGPFGKPALRNGGRCSFNLSHSEDAAVVLIADEGEIGVDVEMLRVMPDALALAERNFSTSENASLRDMVSSARDQAFLTGWTRKEACLKAIGSGLSIAPDTFTAGLAHRACTTQVPTPHGTARVEVDSFFHAGRMLIAWSRVESRTTA